MVAILSVPQVSIVLHCKCKLGCPTGELKVDIEPAARIKVHWPGVSRIFVRVQIMESTPTETMLHMLQDDIESGHSKSDTDRPEANQSTLPCHGRTKKTRTLILLGMSHRVGCAISAKRFFSPIDC